MTEVRSSKQVEISEIDGRLQEHYQARLQSALQELRDHYESQMKQNRDEVEVLFQNKVCLPRKYLTNSNLKSSCPRVVRFKIWKIKHKSSEAQLVPTTKNFFKLVLASMVTIPSCLNWRRPTIT